LSGAQPHLQTNHTGTCGTATDITLFFSDTNPNCRKKKIKEHNLFFYRALHFFTFLPDQIWFLLKNLFFGFEN